ncbi:MAG: ORF6N domain-containing protein [Caldiserica bacterium]|nr:MAG: ORF6N domain-containing protein [Caldisericota bacterium]
MSDIVPVEVIESRIFVVRGQKVMFDKDLAMLYGVETRRLIEQVKRNIKRFPSDFMFQLTKEEFYELRSHFATSKRGGRRYLPYAFTEQGIAMLSSVLNSERAIMVNIQIMRTFVKMRRMMLSYKDLKMKIERLERKYDRKFKIVFDVLKKVLEPEIKEKRRIGF